jgi:5-methylcytosine-specific restriction endonuclease McrA
MRRVTRIIYGNHWQFRSRYWGVRRKAALWRAAYLWYLASPYWQVVRKAALTRANYMCQNHCGQRATQVHHVTYVRLFNELPNDLVALCDRCHADLHHKTPANDNQLTMFPLFAKGKGTQ